MEELIIVGAGGFGREVMQYTQDAFAHNPNVRIKGFLDDNPDSLANHTLAFQILGNTSDYVIQENDRFIVALGNPEIYQTLVERLARRGAKFFTLVHPLAYVAPTAKLGQGCMIAPFAVVGPFAVLEDHVSLNVYASVGHDTHVESYCVLTPYAVINGYVTLEQRVFLGTQAIVLAGKRVGKGSKISAGAVAYRNIPANSLVVGNPGKARVMFSERSETAG